MVISKQMMWLESTARQDQTLLLSRDLELPSYMVLMQPNSTYTLILTPEDLTVSSSTSLTPASTAKRLIQDLYSKYSAPCLLPVVCVLIISSSFVVLIGSIRHWFLDFSMEQPIW